MLVNSKPIIIYVKIMLLYFNYRSYYVNSTTTGCIINNIMHEPLKLNITNFKLFFYKKFYS
jgi:hypothetical protein